MLNFVKLASLPAKRHHFSYLRLGIVTTLACLVCSAASAQTTHFALGATTLLEGPSAGSESVVLAVTPANGTWTATASGLNASLGVAVDGAGNVYIANTASNAIMKWTAASNTPRPCGAGMEVVVNEE